MTRLLSIPLVLVLSLLLVGCGDTETFRYKLTISVETPEGVKTGFSVVEIKATDVRFPERGTASSARGEAIYVDLGAGRRPLVAVMSLYQGKSKGLKWYEGKPDTEALLKLFGEKPEERLVKQFAQLKRMRGARPLATQDLPDLVTFADVASPKTVTAVDPEDLRASLGYGIRWQSMAIEITEEPVTKSIEKKLPWLAGPWIGLDVAPWSGGSKSAPRRITSYSFRTSN
ncbi:MAG: hypothetical protein ABL907_20605 [Hyphomicrobium sp.]